MTRRTSIEAYRRIKEGGLLSRRRFEMYDWLFHNGPASARDAYKILCDGKPINPSSYLSRLSELRDMEVVAEVGEKIDPETKQTVIVWDVTENLPKKIIKPTRHKCKACNGKGFIEQLRML
jgi:hypothetical protein